MIHRFILLNEKQICPLHRGHHYYGQRTKHKHFETIVSPQNYRKCIYNRLTGISDRLWRQSIIIIRYICVCVCGENKLCIMCVNQSNLTDRPANIMMKQNAYVAIVTFFCSVFSPAPSSNRSSLVTFSDFQLHSFFRNLEPKTYTIINIFPTIQLQ